MNGSRRAIAGFVAAALASVALLLDQGVFAQTQEPSAPQAVSAADLQAAIDKLGDLNYDTRTAAARTVRRTPAPQAITALRQAVKEHRDSYVRYRSLVLLTGFNDPSTASVMRESLTSPNDRLRTVAYSYFERHPDRSMTALLLSTLDRERGEFVRPALVRALAALGEDPRVQQALVGEVSRGEDFFRSVVIESLGDYRAKYARDAIDAVSRIDGPLQDDAALALGKIGEQKSLETLALLQRQAPRQRQPSIAAAICLLGVNCPVHLKYLTDTLKFADTNPGFQDLLRGAAAGLTAAALNGFSEAADSLVEIGAAAADPTRGPVSLALGTIALRNTPLFMSLLEKRPNRDPVIALVAEGFDLLEEDLEKETFFAYTRRTYWAAPVGSPSRQLMQALITRLDF